MYLGIDGGGTKTAFALVDAQGHVHARHDGPGSYYLEVGLDGVAQVLRDGIAATLHAAGVPLAALRHAFVGLPAHGEDSALQSTLDALPASMLGTGRYHCGNDMVCSWAGALAARDGISVVAGTGSIAYGEWQSRAARAGGWGEVFGDEGSAYWIAREGLALFSRMSDGRRPAGPLLGLVRQRLDLASDLDLCAQANSDVGRSRLAQHARLVSEAAAAGDAQAQAILDVAASELAALAAAVRQRLEADEAATVDVSYSGGVFGIGAQFSGAFEAALQRQHRGLRLVLPRFEPVLGAALYAARCAGEPLGEVALRALDAAVRG
jgi:N-acetylglucosamine kinase-like BadF-type ATPase